jgi:Transposase DDE domain
MLLPSFLERFQTTFVPQPFRDLARQCGWLQRQGKIDAFEFLISLVFGQLSALRQTLVSQAQCLTQPVSRQGIHDRYNSTTVAYVQAACAHVLALTLDWVPARPQAQELKTHFEAVYLLDSTSFDCSQSLQEIFPSCGGDGSAANIKVLLRYELIGGGLEPLKVLEGKRCDQGQALGLAQRLKPNQLQLADKGFFDAKAWRAAQEAGAYLLMPLPHSATLWLSQGWEGAEQALDLAGELALCWQNRVEWPEVFLGTKGKHRAGPVRLVAFRLSPESAGRQRAGLRESMRTKGRTPSAKALQLAGWLLLVTNAPAAKLPTPMMAYLYRARWQIELIFRQAKSVLRLNQSQHDKGARIQSEIWARLLCAVLLFSWHAHANAQCWHQHGSEISFEKLIRLMQQWGHTLARAFLEEPEVLLRQLRTLWGHLMVNAGKGRQKSRTNTWDHLMDLWLKPKSSPIPSSL